MCDIFEFGIIGMGPAGLGMAMSLRNSDDIRKTICFERGIFSADLNCLALTEDSCCSSKTCGIISGIGGASTLSSGKISDFPAGSGLESFFDSQQQLKESLGDIISNLSKNIKLKKISTDLQVQKEAEAFYKHRNIKYKYYDVYEFDGIEYQILLSKIVQQLKNEGLKIFENAEVIDIERVTNMLCYRIKVRMLNAEKVFFVHNVIVATGGLDIRDKLIEKSIGLDNSSYEIGVRVEINSQYIRKVTENHGDLKLKLGRGRTYCVTVDGRIVVYRTDGLCFLEGCAQTPLTEYTNMAILIKYRDMEGINSFLKRYRKGFKGIPVKQKFVDYDKGYVGVDKIDTTLTLAANGDINKLLPLEINEDIKSFIKKVLIDAMNVPKEAVVLVAPELKVLRNLTLHNNFELNNNLYVIGAATGKFRGILQSYCSGIRCGKLLLER